MKSEEKKLSRQGVKVTTYQKKERQSMEEELSWATHLFLKLSFKAENMENGIWHISLSNLIGLPPHFFKAEKIVNMENGIS